jgi:hypothetical protein
MREWFCCTLFILSVHCLKAQDLSSRTWYLGARAHYGFLWPHRPVAWYLVQDHASAFEVFAERMFRGDKPWQQHYNGPSYGFGFMYSGMANPDVIGGGVRLIPYLHLPFVRGDRSSFGMRLGWGVGYIFKPFDRRENFKQITTGSRINTAIQLMLEYRVDVGRMRYATGLSIDHWSNGAFKLPNLGANLVSVNAGISYALSPPIAFNQMADTIPFVRRKREQSVVGAFGVSEVARPLSGQHSVYSMVAQVQWHVTPKSSFSAGMDIFNKGSLSTIHPELKEMDRIDHTQIGVHGGWALGFGRGELLLQMGAYVYSPYPDESVLFHRLGMRYRSGDHLVWHIALKSHYAVADHWEWGIGYRWH